MILIKNNVERVAFTKEQEQKLMRQGFRPLEQSQGNVESKEIGRKALTKMSVAELKALAKEKGMEGTSSLTREELIVVLRECLNE